MFFLLSSFAGEFALVLVVKRLVEVLSGQFRFRSEVGVVLRAAVLLVIVGVLVIGGDDVGRLGLGVLELLVVGGRRRLVVGLVCGDGSVAKLHLQRLGLFTN